VSAIQASTASSETGLRPDERQREALLEEIDAVLATVHDPAARAPFVALAASVAAGIIGEGEAATLDKVLEMTLQTGRARRIHGADTEQALLRLFYQTPRGGAARRSTEAVNAALHGLAGQTLEDVVFTVQAPGVFKLGLRTDRCRLGLEIDRHGVTLDSLEV
jgi:hypothetical protein